MRPISLTPCLPEKEREEVAFFCFVCVVVVLERKEGVGRRGRRLGVGLQSGNWDHLMCGISSYLSSTMGPYMNDWKNNRWVQYVQLNGWSC